MSDKIKAKLLSYRVFHHGIYCGRAKVTILEGEDKGETIEIPTVKRHEKGETIELYRKADR